MFKTVLYGSSKPSIKKIEKLFQTIANNATKAIKYDNPISAGKYINRQIGLIDTAIALCNNGTNNDAAHRHGIKGIEGLKSLRAEYEEFRNKLKPTTNAV